MMCIAAMKNMTAAIKAKSVLDRAGIPAVVVSLDTSLTKKGCAYGISFPCTRLGEAKRLMSARRVPYGEILGD